MSTTAPRLDDYMVTHRGTMTEDEYNALAGRPLRIRPIPGGTPGLQMGHADTDANTGAVVIDMHTREYWTVEGAWAQRLATVGRGASGCDAAAADAETMSPEEEAALAQRLMAEPRPKWAQ